MPSPALALPTTKDLVDFIQLQDATVRGSVSDSENSLFHKPHINGTPRRCWPFEFKVEFVDNLRDYLCKFHQTDVLANARPRARPELLFPSASEHLDEAQMIHQVV